MPFIFNMSKIYLMLLDIGYLIPIMDLVICGHCVAYGHMGQCGCDAECMDLLYQHKKCYGPCAFYQLYVLDIMYMSEHNL